MLRRFRFIALGVISLLLSASLASAASFPDVAENHPNAAAITSLKNAGVVSGYSDGSFKPDMPVSRAEAVAIILKSVGITAQKSSQKLPFNDVDEGEWFFPMIQKGVALGKLKGYADKTFRPKNPVTLPEALALTLSFFQVGLKGIEVQPLIYGGLDSNDWYGKQAQYAKNMNLIEPDGDGYMEIKKGLTRGQLAEIIYRMRRVRESGKAFDITGGWVTEEHENNFWRIKRPADWEVFKGQSNSVIWKRDTAAGQVFFTRTAPKSARLSISLAAAEDFETLKTTYRKTYGGIHVTFSELKVGGRPALKINFNDRKVMDMVLQLPSRDLLILYGEYGDSPRAEFLKKQLEAMMMSYEFIQKPPSPPPQTIPLEQRMETLRQAILVKDTWKDIAPLFPDKKLNSTDAIGIGTGPVDYYYSKEADHTIKLERSSGIILNIRPGATSSF